MVSLGIDIGGTGCKCVAFREDGTRLALSYREYPNPPGKVNLEPLVLRGSVLAVIGECVAKLPDKKAVAAVTVSSFGESFVPVDGAGDPLTDIILYFANSESAEFDALVERAGAERIMEITRVLPDASYSLAKMLYTEKAAPRPVWKYLFIAGYICYCLSGQPVCDESLACRSLLYDVRARRWSRELLEAAGIREDQLPTVVPTGTAAGKLLPEIAGRLGLPGGVLVVMGSHDQIVNALGAGVRDCGEAVDVSGTCECIEPLFAGVPGMDFVRNNFACVPYVDGRGYVTYAYNISGGLVLKWYRDTLAAHLKKGSRPVYDVLNDRCPASPTGLIVLPYLQGMGGTPDVRTAATGQFLGLTASTTLPELYRGVLEGLCYEMAYNLEKLAEGGVRPTRLYACGGGARSRVWLQIKADIWNREIIPAEEEETGALGSAILGFAAATGEKDRTALAARFVRHGEPLRPNGENRAHYQAQYELFKQYREFSMQFWSAP